MYNKVMERDNMTITMPITVQNIIQIIKSNGFNAYIVGGCVRDSFQGRTPYDWDITTNATPQDTMKIFKDYKQIHNGIKHGTVGVVYDNDLYEITTFRVDGNYKDNRRPENVSFSKNIEDDLTRRDFTINAIAYNDEDGIIDICNGIEDINNKIIRCVGNPDKRFNEDALRILRALRFSATFGYKIESKTHNSIIKNKKLLHNISKERVAVELIKLLIGDYCGEVLRSYHEVIFEIIPELKIMYKYNQHNPYHNLDLWEHTVTAVENIKADKTLRMVMLLHDLGKPHVQEKDENNICHYHNHAEHSEKIANEILKNLKFSRKFSTDVKTLIYYHDYFCSPTHKAVKRLLNKIGFDYAYKLADVQLADSCAKSAYHHQDQIERINSYVKILDEIKSSNELITIKDLNINGCNLIALGIEKGKTIGDILNYLLVEVQENNLENDKTILLAKAEEYYKDNT